MATTRDITKSMTQVGQQPVPRNADVGRLGRGASVTLVGKMLGRAVHVLGQVVFARLLGPGAFGLYAIGWTMLAMIGDGSTLGLDKGVIRYATRHWREDTSRLRGVLFQSLGLTFLSGLLIGGTLYLAAPWLAEQVYGKPDLTSVIRWFSLAIPLFASLRVAAAATTVSQQMRYLVYAQDLARPAANLCLFLVFYLIGWRLFGAVAATVGSFGVGLILAIYYVKRLFPEVFSSQVKSTLVARELLAFSLPASVAGTFVRFNVRVDRLLIGYFRPMAEVGVYQAASQSSILFVIILTAFSSIFSPMVADLYHKKEMERLSELFKVSTKWGLYVSLPLFLVICFAPREVMTVVFGTSYESGCLPLIILALAQLTHAGAGPVGLLLIMTGYQNRWLMISGVMLFVNVALNWLLVPRLGLPGAALATLCAIGGLFFSGLVQVKRSLKIWPYDRRYCKGLLAAASTAGALFLLALVDISSPMLALFLALVVSSGVFGAALLLLGLDTEDREFIYLIQAGLGQRKNKRQRGY